MEHTQPVKNRPYFQFDPGLAEQIGLEESILLKRFRFIIEHNKAHEEYQHNGRTWCFATVRGLEKLYPFWSKHQIERILQSLTDQKVLLKRSHWKNRSDKRSYFSLTGNFQGLSPNGDTKDVETLEPIDIQPNYLGVSPNGDKVSPNGDKVSPNGDIEFDLKNCSTELEQKTVLEVPSSSSTLIKEEDQDKDLPDHHNPRYAEHLAITTAAFEQLAQTPTVYFIRKTIATIDDCIGCWTLEQQAQLLPRIIDRMAEKGQTIHSLPAFLEYHGRGASHSHPYGGELIRMRGEVEPVAEDEVKHLPLDPEVLSFINERFGVKKMTRSSEITLVEDGMESDEQILAAAESRARIKAQLALIQQTEAAG